MFQYANKQIDNHVELTKLVGALGAIRSEYTSDRNAKDAAQKAAATEMQKANESHKAAVTEATTKAVAQAQKNLKDAEAAYKTAEDARIRANAVESYENKLKTEIKALEDMIQPENSVDEASKQAHITSVEVRADAVTKILDEIVALNPFATETPAALAEFMAPYKAMYDAFPLNFNHEFDSAAPIAKQYSYKRSAKYDVAAKSLVLTYTRTQEMSQSKSAINHPDKLYTLGRTVDHAIDIEYLCDGNLKYEDSDTGSFYGGKKPVNCAYQKHTKKPVKKVGYHFEILNDKSALNEFQTVVEKKTEDDIKKIVADNANDARSAEYKQDELSHRKLQQERLDYFLKTKTMGTNTLLSEEDILDYDNRRSKFAYNRSNYVSKIQGTKTVWTYPGSVAAGVKNVCTMSLCYIGQKDWELNFNFAGSTPKKLYKQEKYDTEDKIRVEMQANPFKWGTISGYSLNPLPWEFVNLFILFATISNIGQSWMSAWVSKILSSLWKNICAAISLALIACIDRIFITAFSNPVDWAKTDIIKILLATVTVLLSVLVFQNAPKAPKKEEKKDEKKVEGDLEAGNRGSAAKRNVASQRNNASQRSQKK